MLDTDYLLPPAGMQLMMCAKQAKSIGITSVKAESVKTVSGFNKHY